MSSSRSPSPRRSKSKQREVAVDRHKLFVTSLDGTVNQGELKDQLQELFGKYGKVASLSVRRNKSGEYSFAFVEYDPGFDAQNAVDNLNGQEVKGRNMKVEFQDNSKRRKDPEKGCYSCGMMGHFARECRSANRNGGSFRGRGRDRSRSDSRDHESRRRRRSPSESSQKQRSRHKKKKERKNKSKDRDEKRKKKHKKHRGSSSDSRSD